MGTPAKIYIASILALGLGLGVATLLFVQPAPIDWTLFSILLLAAVAVQWIPHDAPTRSFHPGTLFYFTGVFLLPAQGFVLLVLLAHLVEWGREALARSGRLADWYIQPYNISVHILTGLLVGSTFQLSQTSPRLAHLAWFVVLGLLAAAVYVLLNQALVGLAQVLVQGKTWRETGVWGAGNLWLDFGQLSMGFLAAALLRVSAWFILPVFPPVCLIQHSLEITWLKQQVNRDAKTGLWNSDFFMQALEVEYSRATRYQRPLTVVMADLDYLRDVNNAYGHLAGDAVLIGAAGILRSQFRDYDIVARFGGEEFAILLPEADSAEALPRVEAVRQAIAQAEFVAPTTQVKIKATMSFGVAGINGGRYSPQDLIHRADLAAYVAKVEGRNQVRTYTEDMAGVLARGQSG